MCDLALSTLITRTSNYELREFPASIRMPPMFYADKKEPNFVNAVSYLPEELMPKNPKKTGLVGHYLRPGGGQVAAAAAAQKGGVAKKQPQVSGVQHCLVLRQLTVKKKNLVTDRHFHNNHCGGDRC